MGIHGLQSLVNSRAMQEEEVLAKAEKLIIDGNGYAMFLAEQFLKDGLGRMDIGINYIDFDEYVQAHLQQLFDAKLKVVVFMDGKDARLKLSTRKDRRSQREDVKNSILSAALGGKNVADVVNYPLLLVEQFKFTLQENARNGSIELHVCEYEADQEIAIAVANANAGCGEGKGEQKAFAYANDTDFLVMKDCPYLRFGSLLRANANANASDALDEFGNISNGGSSGLAEGFNPFCPPLASPLKAFTVWRRADVARKLGLTQQAFVELCLVMGNDFTRDTPRTMLDILPVSPPSANVEDLYEDDEDVGAEEEEKEEEETGQLEDLPPAVGSDSDPEPGDGNEGGKEPSAEAEGIANVGHVALSASDAQAKPPAALMTWKPLLRSCPSTTIKLVDLCARASSAAAAAGIAFHVSSQKSGALQLALDYSRSFYDLLDLSAFPMEYVDPADGNAAEVEEEEEEEEEEIKERSLLQLSSSEKAHLRKWMGAQDEKVGRSMHIGSDVCNYLLSAVRVEKLFQGQSTGSCVTLKEYHVEAFRLMREHFLQKTDEHGNPLFDDYGEPIYVGNSYGTLDIGTDTSELNWKNIHAGWFIEYLYGYFLRQPSEVPVYNRREALNYEYPDSYLSSPGYYFDAYLFHAICKELEAELALKNKDDLEIFDDFRSGNPPSPRGKAVVSDGKERLPIDAHKERILENISRDRVTIIHGETGCGKSSRLPIILLDDADANGQKCRMFISQPRRIAASSLTKRVRLTLGDRVALRMGNGVRDGRESAEITYCTTGYLTRLLAHHPAAFDKHTHLIIDEVHERSVDSDLLCMLARRLLVSNTTIKLILMSATIHTDLYKAYFSDFGELHNQYYGTMDVLSVGVRRFPVAISFLEDIADKDPDLPPMTQQLAANCASRQVKEVRQITHPPANEASPQGIDPEMIKLQQNLAVSLTQAKAVSGTCVLIFVSGIADITEIIEKFEGMPRFYCIGIHSDIPEEEQFRAFETTPADKVKVVVATNAAESSLTIPDCDMVICLGTHKALRYHPTSHRVHLHNSWISKASSTQRAGRTGRVRPGVVYRLYTKKLHHVFDEHEMCEVLRTPLQDVILSLRTMLEDAEGFTGVVPVLQDLLEPPSLDNINKSFQVLFASSMITAPEDNGALTSIGKLAGQLPVDLELGRMVGLGCLLGVGAEACVLAMALSQPKTLYRIATRFHHHNPDQLHDLAVQTLLGNIKMDSGLYSDPLSMLVLYIQYKSKCFPSGPNGEHRWIDDHSLVRVRVKQFVASVDHMIERTNKALGVDGLGGSRSPRNGRRSRSVGSHASELSPRSADDDTEADMCEVQRLSTDHLMVDSVSDIRASPACATPALSESVLNRLRLLLAWSGDSNLLSAKKSRKGEKSRANLTEVDLSTSPLTLGHLRNLIPAEIPFTVNTKVQASFTGFFSPERLEDLSPLSLLQSMITACQDDAGKCCWLLTRPTTTEAGAAAPSKVNAVFLAISTNSDSDRIRQAIETFHGGKSSPVELPVQILAYVKDGAVQTEAGPVEEISQKASELLSSAASGLPAAEKKEDAEEDRPATPPPPAAPTPSVRVYSVWVLQDPSNRDIAFYKQPLHAVCDASLDLNLTQNNQAILTANNVTVSRTHQKMIFHADAPDGSLSGRKGEIVVANGGSVRRSLVFGEPTGAAASKSPSPKKKANSATAPLSAAPIPLISDIPLGMRALLAVRGKYKFRHPVRVWQEPLDIAGANRGKAGRFPGWKKVYPWPSLNAGSASAASGEGAAAKATAEAAKAAAIASKYPAGSAAYKVAKKKEAEFLAIAAAATTAAKGASAGGAGGADDGAGNSEHGDDGWNARMEKLKMDVFLEGMPTYTWTNLRHLSAYEALLPEGTGIGGGQAVQVVVGAETANDVCYHTGPHELFAVANGTMTNIVAGTMSFVRCTGITVLPPGIRWVIMAMLARGLPYDQIKSNYNGCFKSSLKENKPAVPKGRRLSKSPPPPSAADDGEATGESSFEDLYTDGVPNEIDLATCQYISKTILTILDGDGVIAPREQLIAAIDELFGMWTHGQIPDHCHGYSTSRGPGSASRSLARGQDQMRFDEHQPAAVAGYLSHGNGNGASGARGASAHSQFQREQASIQSNYDNQIMQLQAELARDKLAVAADSAAATASGAATPPRSPLSLDHPSELPAPKSHSKASQAVTAAGGGKSAGEKGLYISPSVPPSVRPLVEQGLRRRQEMAAMQESARAKAAALHAAAAGGKARKKGAEAASAEGDPLAALLKTALNLHTGAAAAAAAATTVAAPEAEAATAPKALTKKEKQAAMKLKAEQKAARKEKREKKEKEEHTAPQSASPPPTPAAAPAAAAAGGSAPKGTPTDPSNPREIKEKKKKVDLDGRQQKNLEKKAAKKKEKLEKRNKKRAETRELQKQALGQAQAQAQVADGGIAVGGVGSSPLAAGGAGAGAGAAARAARKANSSATLAAVQVMNSAHRAATVAAAGSDSVGGSDAEDDSDADVRTNPNSNSDSDSDQDDAALARFASIALDSDQDKEASGGDGSGSGSDEGDVEDPAVKEDDDDDDDDDGSLSGGDEAVDCYVLDPEEL